jgi:hypothetical protein
MDHRGICHGPESQAYPTVCPDCSETFPWDPALGRPGVRIWKLRRMNIVITVPVCQYGAEYACNVLAAAIVNSAVANLESLLGAGVKVRFVVPEPFPPHTLPNSPMVWIATLSSAETTPHPSGPSLELVQATARAESAAADLQLGSRGGNGVGADRDQAPLQGVEHGHPHCPIRAERPSPGATSDPISASISARSSPSDWHENVLRTNRLTC